jgi:hypothetical protein
MTCRYCGHNKKLIKAHVIPEGFFRSMREGERAPLLLKQNDYARRSPIGVYDSNILCEDCESIFGPCDEYAQGLLAADLKDFEPITDGVQILGWRVLAYRYDLLKLFFMSLLWRASVSEMPFYSRIKLGPFEALAKQHIGKSDPGEPEDFAVVLAKFIDAPGAAMFDPHPDRLEGIKYVRFYLGNYVAYIKTDSRPSSQTFSDSVMKPAMPLTIYGRTLKNSAELPLMREIVASVKGLGKS